MKKRWIGLIALGLLMLSFACKSTGKNNQVGPKEKAKSEKIQKMLMNMESYACNATLKRFANKGVNTYETRQYYRQTGEYRIEILAPENVAGSVTIFDGKMVSQYNPRIEGKVIMDVPESRARDEMFLGNFIKNYMQSEDTAIAVNANEEGIFTILEATIPGDHPYLCTEKLWVNNKDMLPTKLVIYDKEGKEKIELVFNEFAYNMNIDDQLFRVQVHE